jgi:hypothetical protein
LNKFVSFGLNSMISNSKAESLGTSTPSTSGIQLTGKDVLLGRGNNAINHAGNVRFRELVQEKKEEYTAATKERKREIARQLMERIQKEEGGRFLQMVKSNGSYEVASEAKALDKCMHSLREKKREEPPVAQANKLSSDAEEEPLNLREIVDWNKVRTHSIVVVVLASSHQPAVTNFNLAALPRAYSYLLS